MSGAATKGEKAAKKEAAAMAKQNERRGEYKYTTLKDCKPGSDEQYHFYAVVLDASYPHRSFKSDRFICTMKIADPSSPVDKEGVVEHCTLMFFAKTFADLPVTQRIGDIIRVHRAYVQEYKGVKQFTSNIFFNSSWALFSPLSSKDFSKKEGKGAKAALNAAAAAAEADRDFLPFHYFGKSFSFEKSE